MLLGKRVDVVVPAYNEEAHIARTVASVPAYVDHVWVIDDGSRDNTAHRAREVHDDRVRVVSHGDNRGVGAALVTGYREAFAAGADVVAIMAGDGQMDPADLERLLLPVVQGAADYAKGNRFAHGEVFRRMPLTRWLGNHGLSLLTRLCTGLPIHDSQCGYTALGKHGAERIGLDALWTGYGYPNDFLARAASARLRVAETCVLPVYAGEVSGVRLHHALFVVPWVIFRALGRRVRAALARRDEPAASRNVAVSPQ